MFARQSWNLLCGASDSSGQKNGSWGAGLRKHPLYPVVYIFCECDTWPVIVIYCNSMLIPLVVEWCCFLLNIFLCNFQKYVLSDCRVFPCCPTAWLRFTTGYVIYHVKPRKQSHPTGALLRWSTPPTEQIVSSGNIQKQYKPYHVVLTIFLPQCQVATDTFSLSCRVFDLSCYQVASIAWHPSWMRAKNGDFTDGTVFLSTSWCRFQRIWVFEVHSKHPVYTFCGDLRRTYAADAYINGTTNQFFATSSKLIQWEGHPSGMDIQCFVGNLKQGPLK